MTEAARPTGISRIDALKASVAGAGRRVLDLRPSFSKPDIHITEAGVVKGAAAGGLVVGELLGVAGCAPGTTPTATSTEGAHQTPTTIVSPSAIPPSETAYQSQVVETPTPTTTPAEKTPTATS